METKITVPGGGTDGKVSALLKLGFSGIEIHDQGNKIEFVSATTISDARKKVATALGLHEGEVKIEEDY